MENYVSSRLILTEKYDKHIAAENWLMRYFDNVKIVYNEYMPTWIFWKSNGNSVMEYCKAGKTLWILEKLFMLFCQEFDLEIPEAGKIISDIISKHIHFELGILNTNTRVVMEKLIRL